MKRKIKLAGRRQCTGCQVCADACRHEAAIPYIGSDGHYYVKIDARKCTGCGACMRVCPVVSGFSYTNELRKSRPYAAWATNDDLRRRSSSGGVFAAVASYVLGSGGVVVGVAMTGSTARHIPIERIEELPKLQGSKYQQSDASGIYETVLEYLRQGRTVLFSGTGCQVGALYSFLGKRVFDNLFTVDLVCAGVPSRLLIDKYQERVPRSEIVSYRDKIDGWSGINLTTIENDRIKRNSPDSVFVSRGFAAGITIRYSCTDCRFVGLYRKADLTLADFWGETDFPAEHEKGISFLTVHSDRGAWLVEHAALHYHPTTWEKSLNKNPRMVFGKIFYISKGWERICIGKLFDKCSFSTLTSLYTGKYGGWLWFPYRVYRFVIWKCNTAIVRRKVKKIISSEK